MSDELFEPGVKTFDWHETLAPDFCVCDYRPRRECPEHPDMLAMLKAMRGRITVIQKEKHFRNQRFISLPSFNEDLDEEKECEVL